MPFLKPTDLCVSVLRVSSCPPVVPFEFFAMGTEGLGSAACGKPAGTGAGIADVMVSVAGGWLAEAG